MGAVETAWLFDRFAVTVARVDFLDPALIGEPDVRERGVRVEVRPAVTAHDGSVYASPTRTLHPAGCRIDLLESAPFAADRMHWHPLMPDGEPGDRTFEPAMVADPTGWLRQRLEQVDDLLPGLTESDVADVRSVLDEVIEAADRGLAWARRPWPPVDHDDRGMAVGG